MVIDNPSSVTPRKCLIVIGGNPPSRLAVDRCDRIDMIICADSGLDHAMELGLSPTMIIGDFDSATSGNVDVTVANGAEIVRLPIDKDMTDTEAALTLAVERGASDIIVAWGGGDRFDHVLGVVAALAAPVLASLNTLELIVEHDVVTILHGPRTLRFDPTPGTTVSLIPVAGSALGVSSTGLRWNLTDETLNAHAARGVSNIAIGAVELSLIGGVLAVIVPANVERSTEVVQP